MASLFLSFSFLLGEFVFIISWSVHATRHCKSTYTICVKPVLLHVSPCDDVLPVYFLTDLVGKSFQPGNKIMSYVNAKNPHRVLVTTRCLKTLTLIEKVNSSRCLALVVAVTDSATQLGRPESCWWWRNLGEWWRDYSHQVPQQRGIGMVFQSYALLPNMTVEGNIAFGLKMKSLLLTRLSAKSRKSDWAGGLNGQREVLPASAIRAAARQRVVFGKSLGWSSCVFCCLMSHFQRWMRRSVNICANRSETSKKRWTRPRSSWTHDQEEAMIMSDRIFLMNKGEIVQAGTPGRDLATLNLPMSSSRVSWTS